jgi:hypothetical protein
MNLPLPVIAHSPARTRQYIGSPGIAALPDGTLLASHDLFGPGSTRDTTHVYASTDDGSSWALRAAIHGQWWSTLFTHRGALYLMGTTREYGACVIRRSTDGGFTWSTPADAAHGLLLADAMYHCAPVPLLAHNGRLWRGMEEYTGPKWGSFKAFLMSIDEDADLLNAAYWRCTNRIGVSADWLDGCVGGILEGNALLTPDGEVADVLRVHHPGWHEQAALMTVSADGGTLCFDPAAGFLPLPGGAKKFTIRWDAPSRRYWALLNPAPADPIPGLRPDQVRNQLVLASSPDLLAWHTHRTLLSHPDAARVGFQYVDWLFDGADILAAVRTAYPEPDGTPAHNAHDANYLCFLRVPDFRG